MIEPATAVQVADLHGDIATWVGSVGSIIAVIIAAWVFRSESRNTRSAIEQTEKQIATAAEQWEMQRFQTASEQASKVSGWVDVCPAGARSELASEYDARLVAKWAEAIEKLRFGEVNSVKAYEAMQTTYGPNGPSEALWALLICENKSGLPVYDVIATVFTRSTVGWDTLCRFEWPIWPPDCPRKEFRLLNLDGNQIYLHRDLGPSFCKRARVELTYSDSAGRKWVRHREGNLSQTVTAVP